MNASAFLRHVLAASSFLFVPPCVGQHRSTTKLPDTAWTKGFAGRENQLNGDPRLPSLLKQAFPQRQWVWYDHGRLISVADLAQTFIGVPGDALVDQDRYVTATGCVPHDCTDGGLVWIDTAPQSTELIFAANMLVSGGPTSHLWLFVSDSRLNWQQPSSAFLVSLQRWLQKIQAENHVILITLVKPNGVQADLTPSTLIPASSGAGAAQ